MQATADMGAWVETDFMAVPEDLAETAVASSAPGTVDEAATVETVGMVNAGRRTQCPADTAVMVANRGRVATPGTETVVTAVMVVVAVTGEPEEVRGNPENREVSRSAEAMVSRVRMARTGTRSTVCRQAVAESGRETRLDDGFRRGAHHSMGGRKSR